MPAPLEAPFGPAPVPAAAQAFGLARKLRSISSTAGVQSTLVLTPQTAWKPHWKMTGASSRMIRWALAYSSLRRS